MPRRGTNNAPNTRHPKRPPRRPNRLDQFADDLFEAKNETGEELGVTRRQETRALRMRRARRRV